MKKLTLFYLETCPYCHNAKRALQELRKENLAFAQVEIDWFEESKEPTLANNFDYYYVPSVFCEGKKLYEAQPRETFDACKANLRACLEAALG